MITTKAHRAILLTAILGYRPSHLWQDRRVRILVVNAGSSSLKLRVLDDADTVLSNKDLSNLNPKDLGPILGEFLDELPPIDAVGLRRSGLSEEYFVRGL